MHSNAGPAQRWFNTLAPTTELTQFVFYILTDFTITAIHKKLARTDAIDWLRLQSTLTQYDRHCTQWSLESICLPLARGCDFHSNVAAM